MKKNLFLFFIALSIIASSCKTTTETKSFTDIIKSDPNWVADFIHVTDSLKNISSFDTSLKMLEVAICPVPVPPTPPNLSKFEIDATITSGLLLKNSDFTTIGNFIHGLTHKVSPKIFIAKTDLQNIISTISTDSVEFSIGLIRSPVDVTRYNNQFSVSPSETLNTIKNHPALLISPNENTATTKSYIAGRLCPPPAGGCNNK